MATLQTITSADKIVSQFIPKLNSNNSALNDELASTVKKSEQTLTSSESAQVRKNIGVVVDVEQPPFNAVGDGTTDNASALQSACDLVAAAGGGTVRLIPGKDYAFASPLTVRCTVSFEGRGSILRYIGSGGADFANRVVAVNLIAPTSQYGHRGGNLAGIRFIGPGSGVHVVGLKFTTPTTNYSVRASANDCFFSGFGVSVELSHRAYCCKFTNCWFRTNGRDVYFPTGVADGGESLCFDGCTFDGCVTANLDIGGFSDWYFFGCSFDFNTSGSKILATSGVSVWTTFFGCHLSREGPPLRCSMSPLDRRSSSKAARLT